MQRRLLPLLHVLGLVLVLFSLTMLLPLAVSQWYGDSARTYYDESLAITFAAGALLWLCMHRFRRELQARDGFLLVSLVWTVLPAFATLPLMLYLPGLSFTDAYFETVSGITTTGATVLSYLDTLPPSINLWRCELQWLGGLGLIVLAVAILPLLGVGGMQLYKAELPGPMKDAKLTPRITETAKGLWLVYCVITVACVIAYWLAGMNWFDALCHAFSTMGTGGFSTHDASIGYFKSPAIEVVAIIFMLIAGVNFASHFLVWRNRSLKPYAVDSEAGMFLLVTLGSALAIACYLRYTQTYSDFLTALRYAMFNTVSIATTTGFANTDYGLWPMFAPLWMLFLCCFASSAGSTGGGIKMVRARLLFRQAARELARLIHPHAQLPVKIKQQAIPDTIVFAVLGFVSIYLAVMLFATFLLLVSGLDPISAFSAVIACINNTGPGLERVGPATTYAGLDNFQIWVLTITMLLGRLEFFTLLIVFTPGFWRR
ncbi:MAG: TrkH family potassium uptake protein [Burkholderiales bacterium]